MLYLPDPGNWPTPAVTTPTTDATTTTTDTSVSDIVTPRDVLNNSASSASETQATVAAENEPLRVIYGQPRLGAQIGVMLAHGANLVIQCVWGHGEIDSISNLTIKDTTPPSGTLIEHYLGTAGQGISPLLAAAFLQQSPPIAYTDTLPGVAYSVVSVPVVDNGGFPTVAAIVKGLKVWTGAVKEWSDCPAYCLADFETNEVYGAGESVDWASVLAVANHNNEIIGTYPDQEKRRTLNLALDVVQQVGAWEETLKTYASCWLINYGGNVKFVPDKAASPVADLQHSLKHIHYISNVKKRGVQSMPTVMTVTYTDTSTIPYKDGTVTVYAPGVLAGTTPRRESQVSLPGVTRYSQAYREAVERLNKLLLNDLSFTLGVFDEGITLEVGDVVLVTHPLGFTAKQMRIGNISGELGRYAVDFIEYDPAYYSDVVVSTPTYTDTQLPNPASPPLLTGLSVEEEVFQQQNGTFTSRIRATWNAPAYAYLRNYRVELWQAGNLVYADSPKVAEWPTPPVVEGAVYTIKVAAISSTGSTGPWVTDSLTALGKQLDPGNVPSITAFEAGGTVYVSWLPAVDIDIWGYEVRYSPVGGTWASSTLIDRADSLRLTSDQIPVGTWTLYVKALDSVKHYSVIAATCNVVVTSDASAFFVDSKQQTAPTLTNMAEYALARDNFNRYFITEDGVALGTKMPGALSAYTNVLANYHASVTSTWLGESEDYGQLLGGQWTGTASVADLAGAHISYMGNSTDGSTWSYLSGLSQKLNARFARLKHEALTTSTMLVTYPNQVIQLDAIPRSEVGTGTTSASGPVTITLLNSYVSVKRLTITPKGLTARSYTFDNVILGTPTKFDVYIFDPASAKMVSDFQYEFEGI